MFKRKRSTRVLALVAAAGCFAGLTALNATSADALVGNPGAVSIALADGSLVIDAPNLDIALEDIAGTATGTATGAGALSLTSVTFPEVAFDLLGIAGTAELVPSLPWSGTIDPTTGALTMSGNTTVALDIPALSAQCTMGPLALNLTTGTSGPATGVAYNQTTGAATIVGGDTAIPAVPASPTCAISGLINGQLPLPLAAGNTIISFGAQLTPVLNDTPTGPSISVNDVTVAENDKKPGKATFTVSLSQPAASTVKVSVTTVDGTASSVNKADFTALKPKTISIPAGQTSKTFDVQTTGDSIAEPTENFTVVLSNAVGAPISDSTGIGTINDTDPITMSIVDQQFAEGNKNNTILVTVQIDRPSDNTIKAKLTTVNGTATDPTDFKKKTGTGVTFKPGSTTATVKLTVVGDTVTESDETFSVTLSDASGANLGDSSAVITLLNDDGVPI